MPSFDETILQCANAASAEWGYPPVAGDWLHSLHSRLPVGLRQAVLNGLDDSKICLVDGHRFSLLGLSPGKGPYAFFSRSSRLVPSPNWEYFVQAAEYIRLARGLTPNGLRVDFEDGLMDVSVYERERLVWCVEVKERARDLSPLLTGLRRYGEHIDLDAVDRHNDPLRKAKYILRHRPLFFSLVAIGQRLDFSVAYGGGGFRLTEDVVPFF